MELEAYLIREDIPSLEFGERIGLKQPNSIYRYLRGTRKPRPDIMANIIAETGGQVTPNDFFADELLAARHPEAAARRGIVISPRSQAEQPDD